MNAAQKIDRIEPTNWFVGMKNPQVQLMVYGKDVRTAEVSTDYPACASTRSCVSTRPTIC